MQEIERVNTTPDGRIQFHSKTKSGSADTGRKLSSRKCRNAYQVIQKDDNWDWECENHDTLLVMLCLTHQSV